MPGCAVIKCKNATPKGFRLFRLPSAYRNAERRQIWLNLIGRPNLYEDARVCESHFSEDQFERARMDGKKRLKPNAIPDLLQLSTTTNDSMDNNREQTAEIIVAECDECSHLTCNETIKVEAVDISHEEDENITNAGSDYGGSFESILIGKQSDNELVEILKQRLKSALRKCRDYERKLQQKHSTNLEKIFNQDQLEFLETEKRRGTSWSEDTITKALKLYMLCGTDGYNELRRQKLPYPSIRTLQHRLRNTKLKPGEIFEILGEKFEMSQVDDV